MAGLVASAAIVSGELIIGLSDGSIIRAGYVQGPQGLTGERGPMGNTGRPGADGNTVHHSTGRPRPDLGRDGDFCIDTVNWEIFFKDNGTWGKGQPLLVSADRLGGLDQGGKQIKGGPGRFFPMGGASSSVTPTPASQGGLEPIIGNGNPFGANLWSPIAIDDSGDLMEITLYMSAAGGNQVYTCKVIAYRANTIGNLTIAWESSFPDDLAHVTEFDAQVNGTELTVRMRSNMAWTEVRGTINKL